MVTGKREWLSKRLITKFIQDKYVIVVECNLIESELFEWWI